MNRVNRKILILIPFVILMVITTASGAGLTSTSRRSGQSSDYSTYQPDIVGLTSTKKDNEIKDFPNPPGHSHRIFEFWFDINISDKTKKDIEFPPTNIHTPNDTDELRYLILGTVDQRMALLLRLVDKAKERQINPYRFAEYLYSLQIRGNPDYLSLDDRVFNVIIELCLYEIGDISMSQLQAYLRRISYSSYNQGPDENTFNYIIHLLENYVFSPREAIDCLVMLRQSTGHNW